MLIDIARIACELTGASTDLIDEIDGPAGRAAPRISIDRLRSLGWRPEVGLKDGLRLLLESGRPAPAV